MALDKLVDSAQLDSDLTSVANAIRTKGGTSALLAFPSGFVSAVEAIETGGDPLAALDAVIDRSAVNVASNAKTIAISRLFESSGALVSVSFPECTTMPGGYVFKSCSNLSSIYFPKLSGGAAMFAFQSCPALTAVVLPSLVYFSNQGQFSGCTGLRAADLGAAGLATSNALSSQKMFDGCSALDTVILRYTGVKPMGSINTFNGTPFASGNAGGTIYIPKSLYDHLGDGSALDYKAATNWSTLDGYGTVTWAQIEGSIYETQYADGTPIPTT